MYEHLLRVMVAGFQIGLVLSPFVAPTVPEAPQIEQVQVIETIQKDEITPLGELTATKSAEIAPKVMKSVSGKVSHYSVAGCLGCSPTLTMANGERLNDSVPTIACNRLPLNSTVRVTNLDNGLSVMARVTDTGGFEKYNRIADLTPAVYSVIQTKTDVSNVLIEVLEN